EDLATKDLLVVPSSEAGPRGGSLIVLERAEPKTLNPVTALDVSSRDVIRRMMADLISINRRTLATQPSVAKSWTVSRDGREYTVEIRRGLQFSDGHAMDADDVVFTFRVYLDESVHSPQRDLLIVGGQPVAVEKIDAAHVRFRLAQPYAAAERIFDSLAVLPRHLLERPWRDGKLGEAWSVTTPPAEIAGLGPFRLKEYHPGEKIVLERNPYYWKTDQTGNRLPYLDRLEFRFVASEDAQVAQFLAGEADVLNRVGARNFELLRTEQRTAHEQLKDLGPGLEYNFLFLNLGPVDAQRYPDIAAKQNWFRDVRFRQAISTAVDRDGIVRLVYGGRATPLRSSVTPANAKWLNDALPHPAQSLEQARRLLKDAGFHWNADQALTDAAGKVVQFSIVVSSSSPERGQMATIIQDDLKKLGIQTQVVSLEFRALLDRVLNSRQYEACILGLVSGDTDPNPEMNVWLSSGGSHLWNPNQAQPMTAWEAEIDRLMRQQMTTLGYARRKQLYDRVQQIAAENVPLVFLASPHILVAARKNLGNFDPAVVDHYTLWNAEQLYWRSGSGTRQGGPQ
ncbi:MAG TPA: ABC transporter substrate-binding protein, partial [Bryobacteraceae bacterium]|nr:ABC transporter substrate-binding protein [Bryobacteraceae bacterium]